MGILQSHMGTVGCVRLICVNSPATNAVSFGKHGCLGVLSKVLAAVGKRDFAVLK